MKSHVSLLGLACVLGLALSLTACSSDSSSSAAGGGDSLTFTFGSNPEETISGGPASSRCVVGSFLTGIAITEVFAERNIGLVNAEHVSFSIYGNTTGSYPVAAGPPVAGDVFVAARLGGVTWLGFTGSASVTAYGAVGGRITGTFNTTVTDLMTPVTLVGSFDVTREPDDGQTTTDSACA